MVAAIPRNGISDATQTAGTTTTNVSTRYTYDAAGNLATMIDARANTTTYGYDAAGRMTALTDALGEALIWKYDALGNRTRQENRSDSPMTASITWTHDGAGRILTRIADGVTTTYAYDAAGNRLTASDGTLTITATYDRLDRPLTVDDEDAGTTADTTYTYSLTSPTWTDPSGSYAATLDRFDRPLSLNDPASATDFSWTYRADGQPSLISRPDGNHTELAYDALGHLTGSDTDTSATTGGTDRAVYAWTHNRAGQVLTETSTITGDPSNGTVTYAYDPLERLTSATLAGNPTASYGWDAVPNRTAVGSATTSYDAANRPTSGTNPTAAYTSDDDGRLLTAPGNQYTWDRLGRLTQVRTAGGTTLATYSYDPLDRLRLVDYPSGTDIRFRYTGLTTQVAQWLDHGAGTVTRSVANGWTGERLADWTGTSSNLRTYGTNAHRDVTWLATSSGTVSAALRYDPWGTPRATVPSGYSPFRFQGAWSDDATSLSWVVTRWYAPALGRFLSEDSLLGEPADPPSRHLYAYGAGEPVGRWDPDGMRWCSSTCTHSSLYHGADSKYYTRSMKNPTGLKGKFIIQMFISTKWSSAGPWVLKGDWRGYDYGGCLESRACIVIDFSNRRTQVRIRPTCERKDFDNNRYVCDDAKDINVIGFFSNAVRYSESSGGVVHLAWSLVPSSSVMETSPVTPGLPSNRCSGSRLVPCSSQRRHSVFRSSPLRYSRGDTPV